MFSEQIDSLSLKAEQEFGALTNAELNCRPSSEKWSIGQCLDHLIVSNGKYIPLLKMISDGTYKNSFWEKINPLANYTGKKMIETLGPKVIKKYDSPLIFKPSRSDIGIEIMQTFKIQQEELKTLFDSIVKDDKTSMLITSPVASLITLKVGDALNLIIAHEERHLNQAIAIKESRGFGRQ